MKYAELIYNGLEAKIKSLAITNCMEMTKVLGAYSSGQADAFRKSIGKKSQKVMDEELPKLHQAIVANGYGENIATEVVEIIKPFVGYGLTNYVNFI